MLRLGRVLRVLGKAGGRLLLQGWPPGDLLWFSLTTSARMEMHIRSYVCKRH